MGFYKGPCFRVHGLLQLSMFESLVLDVGEFTHRLMAKMIEH